MSSHSDRVTRRVAALACCLVATAASAQDLPRFRADLLPGQPGPLVSLAGVTDQGLVAGSVSIDGHGRAFVADASGFSLLPLPAGTTSCLAADVNHDGLVVGQAYNPFPPVAVIWTPTPSGYDVWVVPPVGKNTPDQALGCNDRGDVVGRTNIGHPCVWSASAGFTNLAQTLGLGWHLQDVNESRVGVGSAQLDGLIDASTPGWATGHGGVISRSGRLAVPGNNALSGESGVVLLTRLPFVDLGGSTPGLTGRPVLRGEGDLTPGADVRLRLLNGRPGTQALLFGSVGATPVPFKGGVLHALPALLQIWLTTDAAGRISLDETWPAVPAGTELVLQFGLVDAASPFGAVLSNGLSGVTL